MRSKGSDSGIGLAVGAEPSTAVVGVAWASVGFDSGAGAGVGEDLAISTVG